MAAANPPGHGDLAHPIAPMHETDRSDELLSPSNYMSFYNQPYHPWKPAQPGVSGFNYRYPSRYYYTWYYYPYSYYYACCDYPTSNFYSRYRYSLFIG